MRTGRFFSIAFVVGICIVAGCTSAKDDDSVNSAGSRAATEPDVAWPRDDGAAETRVPVCWEASTMNDAVDPTLPTSRGWVQDAITKTWEAASNLRFTGWGACTASSRGIRIINNPHEGPHVKDFGRRLDGVVNGMVLDFNFTSFPGCSDPKNRERCIREIAAHEFGHAIGFRHEQARSDTPTWCRELLGPRGAESDGVLIGPWDTDSIMNYCKPSRWRKDGSTGDARLTQLDINAVRLLYGAHGSPAAPPGLPADAGMGSGNGDGGGPAPATNGCEFPCAEYGFDEGQCTRNWKCVQGCLHRASCP